MWFVDREEEKKKWAANGHNEEIEQRTNKKCCGKTGKRVSIAAFIVCCVFFANACTPHTHSLLPRRFFLPRVDVNKCEKCVTLQCFIIFYFTLSLALFNLFILLVRLIVCVCVFVCVEVDIDIKYMCKPYSNIFKCSYLNKNTTHMYNLIIIKCMQTQQRRGQINFPSFHYLCGCCFYCLNGLKYHSIFSLGLLWPHKLRT